MDFKCFVDSKYVDSHHISVFFNTPKLIKEMLAMEECAGRPFMMAGLKSKTRMGLIDPDSGPFWKDQKRFVLKSLRDYGFGKKSEENIKEESKTLINHISDNNTTDKDFLIKDIFNIPVVNVIWKMVANRTFAMDSLDGLEFVQILDEIFSKRDAKSIIPFFGKFTSVHKRRKELFEMMNAKFLRIIEDHEASLGNET